MLGIFREICAVAQADGVTFDADAIKVERNREELEYGGAADQDRRSHRRRARAEW